MTTGVSSQKIGVTAAQTCRVSETRQVFVQCSIIKQVTTGRKWWLWWGRMRWVAIGWLLLAQSQPIFAHPLDEYLQSTYLTLTPDAIEIEIDLTPGLLVTSEVIAVIDRDGDGELSEQEGEFYVNRVANELELTIDGQPQSLRLTSFQMPELFLLEAGAGVIELALQAEVDTPIGSHQLTYYNQHQPVNSIYQVTPRLSPDAALTIEEQTLDDTGQQIEITYTIAEVSQPAEDKPETTPTTEDEQEQPLEDQSATTATQQWLLTALGLTVALALVLLFVLGGLLLMVRRKTAAQPSKKG